jgi:hypothetical protein
MLTSLHRVENGSVLVIVAAVIGGAILMAALVINLGHWFTDKRDLQNRADAGALAAGLSYAELWRDCLGTDAVKQTAAATAIEGIARQYTGDPSYLAGALYNTDVVPQSKVGVSINGTGFGAANDSAGGPCVNHTADAISPTGGVWTDAKVQESNATTFFGLGLPILNINAQARVELHPLGSTSKFQPMAIPLPTVFAAQVRLYNKCTGALLGTYDLGKLNTASQTLANTTLWGTPDGSGNNTSVQVPLPSVTGCNQDYVPISEEVRVAGKTGIDLNQSCATLSGAQFSNCWSDVTEVRAWKNSDPTTGAPLFKDVKLVGGTCAPDAYFSRTASCQSGVSVDVDWGDRDDGNKAISSNFTVSVNGVPLLPPGATTPTGVWTTPAPNIPLSAGGATTLTLDWTWNDPDPTHSWRNGGVPNCKSTGNNPCSGSAPNSGIDVQRGFVGTDANAGIVQLAKLTNTATVDPGQGPVSEFDSVQATGNTVPVYLTVGFTSGEPFGPLVNLRSAIAQANGSINCNNVNQGVQQTFQMFVNGCTPYYGVNTFTSGPWWTPPGAPNCPAPNNFLPNSAHAPWLCGPGAPGLSGGQIADGIAAHTGNCIVNNNNNGCATAQCVNTNKYVAGTIPDSSDPRLITLFIVPYGAFNGQTGGSYSVPIIDFGRFYVTAWGGTNGNADVCVGDNTAGLSTGDVVGHFVDVPTQGDPDLTASCTPTQLRPCQATLIR